MPISAWNITSPKLRLIAARYKAPVEVLASLKNADAVAERVGRAWRLAHDNDYAKVVLAGRSQVELFGRPEGLDIKRATTRNGDIVMITLRFKTVAVQWVLPADKFEKLLEEKGEERMVEELTSYVYVKAERRMLKTQKHSTYVWRAESVSTVSVEEDRETFKRLVEVYARRFKYPIIAALAALWGWTPDVTETEFLVPLVARFAALVGDVAEPTLHLAEFGIPGLGKTTWAIIADIALKWRYFSEPPTPPTLVGDARTGWSPLSSAGGIVLDEFDAYAFLSSKEDFKESIMILHGGLENCIWKRSKGGVKAPEVKRCLPVVLFGNISADGKLSRVVRGTPVYYEVGLEPRRILRFIVGNIISSKVETFDQRIAMGVTVVKEDLPEVAQTWTLSNAAGRPVYGKPSVIRGAVNLLRERIAETWNQPMKVPKVWEGEKARYQRRFEALARVLRVLLAPSLDALADEKEAVESAKRYVEGVVVR